MAPENRVRIQQRASIKQSLETPVLRDAAIPI
jgi:hypothetical protein